jgi:hypothetical protein
MPRLTTAVAATSAVLIIAACSSPSHKHDAQSKPPAQPVATSVASSPATTAGALSGRWSGTYSGAYSGTFVLRWQQHGSRLSGHITLSNPGSTLPIHGSVHNGKISFGTVGSTDITYSGSVSGDSMSGSYQVHTPNGTPGGPWSASRS